MAMLGKTHHLFSSVTTWVVIAVFYMAIGTTLELFLLTHYEDEWQLLPIILICLTMLVFLNVIFRRSLFSLGLLKLLLLSCVVSGLLGIYFHLNANLEFEAELHPTQSFQTTLLESFSGALPALAPGSMIVFALLGYIYILIITKEQNHETIN